MICANKKRFAEKKKMGINETRKTIIENYIKAYNSFDIEGMLQDLDSNIEFKNVSNGEVNLTTQGIVEFKAQAEKAKNIFSQREQKITNMTFSENEIVVEISYQGTLAVDLPNGLQAGNKLELKGKSIFRFSGDKIIEIEDIS